MALSIEPTDDKDLVELAANILPADRAEILATGFEPLEGLFISLDNSVEAVTFRWNNQVATVVGLSQPLPLGDLNPWMISTNLILEHPKILLDYSQRILGHWQSKHSYLTNRVDVRHTRAIRWLKWLGATFDPPEPFGPYGRPFLRFHFGAR